MTHLSDAGVASAAAAGRPNVLHRATLALEQTTALDAPSALLAPLAEALVGSPVRRNALQGLWLGHALHPLLVMVPLGSWSSVTLLDIVGGPGGRDAARTLTGFGVLTAVPAAITGLAEWAGASQRDRRTATVHAAINSVALALYVKSWRARRAGRHDRGARLAAAGLAVSGAGGYLGGHLTEARKVGSRHPVYAQD